MVLRQLRHRNTDQLGRSLDNPIGGDWMNTDDLVTDNLGLVYHIARRFCLPQVEPEDVASIGSIGLIKASRTYAKSKGKKFSTYAGVCIKNEILTAFRKETIIVSSLDDPVRNVSEDITLLDLVPSRESVEDEIDRIFANKELYKLIEKLPEHERFIVKTYYGIDCQAIPQSEVAKCIGRSQPYVAKALKTIHSKLRTEMEVLYEV